MTSFATLDAWLAHLETGQAVGVDMDLTHIGRVKDDLGLSFDCPVITVSGTNGKGSTCAILETVLLRAGYRVGCYTSPHLLAFNERAGVNGADASDADLLEHFEAVEHARASLVEPVSLTYFEFATLATPPGRARSDCMEGKAGGSRTADRLGNEGQGGTNENAQRR
jgi:dihydrofolate synthase / folylpolyglutamate synthase